MTCPTVNRAALIALLCLLLSPGLHRNARAGEPAPSVPFRATPPRLELWESISEKWDWSVPPGAPSDRFDVPVLALTRLPAKYNATGLKIDREVPLAIRVSTTVTCPPGEYRWVLRSRGAARLICQGEVLAETAPLKRNSSGHEDVPAVLAPIDPRWRAVAPGEQESIVAWKSDGQPRDVVLLAILGPSKLRPEPGELLVALVGQSGVPVIIGSSPLELTDSSFESFLIEEEARFESLDDQRRRLAASSAQPFWDRRHDLARQNAQAREPVAPARSSSPSIDRLILATLQAGGKKPDELVNDAAFFRRLALDTIGQVPEVDEVKEFLADNRPDKRVRAIERRLADPRWADHWMGYWQDVLAENPGILKPTLNNTGPFRDYLHAAFRDNLPFDRFATELIRMDGSTLGGGPAGFSMASQNDAPLAAKAHILMKAFLALDMKCARCHDAPTHPFDQADLFGVAGYLAGKPIGIPATSTVRSQPGGRTPAVSVSLRAGDLVPPRWGFPDLASVDSLGPFLPDQPTSRDRLAALVTNPANTRFAAVIANRLWKRYFAVGLVEPVDDWDNSPKSAAPELLDHLAQELMSHQYDLKHLARLILNSRAYQSRASESAPPLIAPAPRRMSSEQLLDSLFAITGKAFRAEELNIDRDGRRPPSEFINLGIPRRAWQLTSTSNERDRPALSLPVVQSLVDLMETFGWRPSRQDPISQREEANTPLQPALLANGTVGARVTRLSDDNVFTDLSLNAQTTEELVNAAVWRVLSREPTAAERDRLVAYLAPSFPRRVVPGAKKQLPSHNDLSRRVSWSNHLHPEATVIQMEMEKLARAGEPPTKRLTAEFRERMEDVLWVLINSPEFVFVP